MRDSMGSAIAYRLEQYTIKHPAEVLLVTAYVRGEEEQLLVFRGFSSSLTGATAFDPDVPVLPDEAEIATIDRLQAPYRPEAPRYLQRAISLDDMETLLKQTGV